MLHESLIDEHEQKDGSIVDEHSTSFSNNDDLKELCLLLDEERLKMHQLAEQWKHFGTSTIHKLECQIIDYQDKLIELEHRQNSLLQENYSLKSFVDQMTIKKSSMRNIGTQTSMERNEPFVSDLLQNLTIDDPLQQQISLQNMFDAIKTVEVYESIESIAVENTSGKQVLKEFCNLVWKYLEERSKPKSSCLL